MSTRKERRERRLRLRPWLRRLRRLTKATHAAAVEGDRFCDAMERAFGPLDLNDPWELT